MTREYRKKPGLSNTLFLIVFCVVAIGMICYALIDKEQQEERARAFEQQQREERQLKEEAERLAEQLRQEKIDQSSFYQKLAEGFDVNILIVGDSIGASSGASAEANAWPEMLCASLQEKYGVKTKLTNVSMGGNSSYSGYVRTMLLDDDVDYDLVVICYGENDNPNHFGLFYESMIRAVRNRYPKASIISMMESSQREYTEKMQTIQTLAAHYGIPVVDTIKPFQENYDNLVKDGKHPNDEGYKIYYEQVLGVIEQQVQEYRGYDLADAAPVNVLVTMLDVFEWYGVDQFTREGNTFTLNTQLHCALMAFYYISIPECGQYSVLIDGIVVREETGENPYDFSMESILRLNAWPDDAGIDVQREIKVVFPEDENGTKIANLFKGITVNGREK